MAHEALGKSFLEEVASKLPESQRAAFTSVLASAEAQAALDLAGSRVAPIDTARQELDQRLNVLNTKEAKLKEWHQSLGSWVTERESTYAERERKLAEREATPPSSTTPHAPPQPGTGGASGVTAEVVADTVQKIVGDRERSYVDVIAETNRLSMFHLKHTGEVLDTHALMKDPEVSALGLEGVYRKLHKPVLDAITKKADDAVRETIRQEEREKLRAEQPADLPYPVGEGGSPLDHLSRPAAERPKGDVLAATRMYEELVGGRR
jgi:hypothetical protein